jgi:predicted alternative tryptophan synthase beta-subunit
MVVDHGVVEARAYKQNECFAEAVRFARSEGFLPAPESAHALRAVAEEAAAAREAGEARTILFGLSGARTLRHVCVRRVLRRQARRHRAVAIANRRGNRAAA